MILCWRPLLVLTENASLTWPLTHDSFAIFGSWMKDFPALLPGGQSPVLTYFKHSATRAVEIPRKRREIKWLSTYQWWWFSHTRSDRGWEWEERRTQCSVCPHLQAQRNEFPGSASSVFGPWCPLVCIYTVTNNLVHKLWLFICKSRVVKYVNS